MIKLDPLFIPKPMTPAERTTAEARAIIGAETSRRETLTAALKEARLAKNAAQASGAKKKAAKAKKA